MCTTHAGAADVVTMTNTNISLANLRVLLTVVEKGSLSRAAAAIGITQSGVSQSIKQLEQSMGGQLLLRGRTGVVTTELGRAVLTDIRIVLEAIKRIRRTCNNSKDIASGEICVASVPGVADRILPAMLAQFETLYPEVKVALMQGTDGEVCEWVEHAVVDLGLSGESTSELQSAVVATDEFVLVVGSGHHLAGRAAASLEDIAEEPFLMSTSGCEPAIRRVFSQASIDPRVAFRVGDTRALMSMVGRGLGVTIMPELAIPTGIAEIFCSVLQPRQERRILAVTRRDQVEMPAVTLLLDVLKRGTRQSRALSA
jgi:DNA-binding transcriptional LysR family regulator